jgi:predicted transcriptional regulator
MKNHLDTSNNAFQHKRQLQDKNIQSQLKTIFHYLSEHIATASMVSEATRIPQKNITRFKRDLEKAGLLWETEKKLCIKTGFRAWYLTTNPDNTPFNNQLNLFE